MSDSSTPLPASPNFEKLNAKLRELFELDKADLDFGIYRILRQRHKEISEFLDRHLEKTVQEALQAHSDFQTVHLRQELEKAEAAAQAAGIAPEQAPKVIELRKKLVSEGTLEATADEVYSHLLTFFSRYYQEGDFLGLHRSTIHGREKYMIPYNGEEVKLVWANMDQYYIKSSELLRDYTFHIRSSDLGKLELDDVPTEVTVHFKLVEGDTEKDNRKANGKTNRVFVLDPNEPWEEQDNNLWLRFRYQEQASERNLQQKLNVDAEQTLADSLPAKWKAFLFTTDPTYKGKDRKDIRTIFQRHLRVYTAKHQFDYFIHKDLGEFLRRELDFYIKNEVMHLDDIEDTTAPKAEEYFSKVKALRRCALPVIRMLTQLEEFQKKLWLKKKFVVETRYCITLDRVPESLYPEICQNDAQREEWVQLYAIDEIERDTIQPGYSNPLKVELLKANPYMMLDTLHFNQTFTYILLSSIENIEESIDGVCLNSDNGQALQLMLGRYGEEVSCIYIDPPFNTDATPIIYKNGYKSSTWSSLIRDRISVARHLLNDQGVLVAAIDDEQQKELSFILSSLFQARNLGTICVRSNPSGRPTKTGYSVSHEYLLFVGKSLEASIGRLPPTKEQMARFNQRDKHGVFEWRNLRREGSNSDRTARPYLYYPIYISPDSIRVPKMTWNEAKEEWTVEEDPSPKEQVVFPDNDDREQKTWRWEGQTVMRSLSDLSVRKDRSGRDYLYYKRRPHNEGVVSVSSWFDAKYLSTEHGTALLKDLFGKCPFSYPKSIYNVVDSIYISGAAKRTSLTVDFFAGSGTTGHAVINLNRDDGGTRKYVLVEMGDYFHTVLIPRLKKVVYSTEWEDGKPKNRNRGIPHSIKVVQLESYEDTLNNLRLQRDPEQEAALQKAQPEQQDEYMLGYFLDVESKESASLLNLDQFRDPFGYQLQIATRTAGETKTITVDLVETFNWLLGLKVHHIDHQKGFLTVTGVNKTGGRTLIIWRTLGDNPTVDNTELEKYLEKIQVNPADTEYTFIYINGSHSLSDPNNKIHLIEETFQRLMFADQDFESLR